MAVMLIAIDAETGARTMGTVASRGTVYRCPQCHAEPLTVKQGRIMVHHYAHPASVTTCDSEPETPEHADGKLRLATIFGGDIEVGLGTNRRRRADVFVADPVIAETSQALAGEVDFDLGWQFNPRRFDSNVDPFVVEFQCSPIRSDEWLQRTRDYNKMGLPVLWVWGLNHFSFHQESWYGGEEWRASSAVLDAATPWVKSSIAPVLVGDDLYVAIMRYTRWKRTLRKLSLIEWPGRLTPRLSGGAWVLHPVLRYGADENDEPFDLLNDRLMANQARREEARGATR